ncbi:MAG: signal peptidase I [Candidatus Saccharibacteria bacterium]|nr:signal peptidase I [Candidatus Saccharibacteria bacterium]
MPPQNTNEVPEPETPQVSVVSNEQTSGIVDQDNPEESDSNSKKDSIKGILSTVAILVIAPLIALSLTAFVFQSYEVDGPSMQTTLQNHDRLIVYKLPRTIAKITRKPYIPKRTDIIIFTRHDSFEFGTDKPRQLVKRVIALPGERITVKKSVVTVYNEEHPEGFKPDEENKYGKVITNTSGDIDLVVPTDSIFVCGDNRPNSLDSRAFGPVPLTDVVGKLSLRVYPFKSGQSF